MFLLSFVVLEDVAYFTALGMPRVSRMVLHDPATKSVFCANRGTLGFEENPCFC